MAEDALRAALEKHHRDGYTWALSCCWRDPATADRFSFAITRCAVVGMDKAGERIADSQINAST
jgi:hypothetical protein